MEQPLDDIRDSDGECTTQQTCRVSLRSMSEMLVEAMYQIKGLWSYGVSS